MQSQGNLLTDFIEFEKENNPFLLEIQHQPFWFLIRFELFFKLLKARKLTNIEGYTERISPKEKLKRTLLNPDFWRHLAARNIFKIKKCDILFINHPRRVLRNGFYECKYTDPILSRIRHSCSVIEYHDGYRHHTPIQTKNLFYIDALLLIDRIVTRLKLLFFPLSPEDKGTVSSLTERMNRAFGADFNRFNIERFISGHIVRFLVSKRSCTFILKRTRPRILFFTSYYSRLPWLSAARDLNIKTVEIQHGTAGINHIAYNMNDGFHNNFLPDYFFLFGNFWKESLNLPIPSESRYSVGLPFLEEAVKKFSSRKQKDGPAEIIFVSQPTIGVSLAKIAIDLQKMIDTSKYRLVFKLHPWEHAIAQKTYSKELSESGINVIYDEISLYELFSSAGFQIGVYSTALYEGIAFGLKTIIMKLMNHEVMYRLYDSQTACLARDANDISKKLESFVFKEGFARFLWQENSIDNFENAVENIMSQASAFNPSKPAR